MCGFVSVVGRNGRKVDAGVLREMAGYLSHRGPDDQGIWQEGTVGFYHLRLSIIDLVSGQQPMTRDGVTIAFNGEIYNYVELRKELKKLGTNFGTTSDTEVLLQSYLNWGTEFLQKLVGMFAFVIFDANKGRVLAARDHFGIKPLYRYEGSDFLLYASEIKALLAHPEVRARVDATAMEDYITFQYALGERTLFQGITKVLPAHYEHCEISDGVLKRVRYWDPDYSIDRSIDTSSAVLQLQDMLRDSVRLQMRSDVPVATYLSGGLDSSTVTVLAAKNSPLSLQTFSGAFREGPEYDETDFAKAVAESIEATTNVIYPSEQDFIDLLPGLVYAMDEPAAGPGLFPQYMVSKSAHRSVS